MAALAALATLVSAIPFEHERLSGVLDAARMSSAASSAAAARSLVGVRLLRPSAGFVGPSSACVVTSTCEESMLVTGNASADTVLVFEATSFDAGWPAFYALFDDWDPHWMYAVAPGLPGTVTVPPVPSGCDELSYNDSVLGDGGGPVPCVEGIEAKLDWFQNRLRSLVPEGSGKTLFLVGHSLGGTFSQEYIRRGLQPAPRGLVLISNPTDTLWSPMYAAFKVRGAIKPYGVVARDVSKAVFESHHPPPFMWGYWSENLNRLLDEWIGSPAFVSDLSWWENTMQAEMARRFLRDGRAPAAPAVEHLMLYGINAAGNKTWEHVFPGLRAGVSPELPEGLPPLNHEQISSTCAPNVNCTLQYVLIDDHSSECEGSIRASEAFGISYSCSESDPMWGHWLHIDNPVGVREAIEAWVLPRSKPTVTLSLESGAWPTKNADNARSGWSRVFAGPTDLTGGPAWRKALVQELAVRDVEHCISTYASPTVDDHGNVYLPVLCSALAGLHKYASDGTLLWRNPMVATAVTPVISRRANGEAILILADGPAAQLWIVDAETGEVLTTVFTNHGIDQCCNSGAWMLAAGSGVIVAPSSSGLPTDYPLPLPSHDQLVAYSASTGELIWIQNLTIPAESAIGKSMAYGTPPLFGHYFERTYNPMPVIYFEGTDTPLVLIMGASGGVYAYELFSGKRMWSSPPPYAPSFSTGGCIVREVSRSERKAVAYCTSNSMTPDSNHRARLPDGTPNGGHGCLRALDAVSGEELWRYEPEYTTSSAAAFDDERVYFGAGVNVCISNNSTACGDDDETPYPGFTGAVNISTGELLWRLDAPDMVGAIPPGNAPGPKCEPDAWVNPAVDAHGTVYTGWQGGYVYAIDGRTGALTGNYSTAAGIQAAAAITNGAVYFATCTELLKFEREPQELEAMVAAVPAGVTIAPSLLPAVVASRPIDGSHAPAVVASRPIDGSHALRLETQLYRHADRHGGLFAYGSLHGTRIAADLTPTNDTAAPRLFRTDGTTYLAAGDPDSETLVLFMHTTSEASGVFSFYNMLYGWRPSFYAVSLDMPGDYGTPAVACPEATVDCSPHEQKPNPADCSGAHLDLLKWAHRQVRALMRGRSRLVLAGISFGGVLWEDYVQWRTRMGDPPIDGLILWSNPTSDVWCSHLGGGGLLPSTKLGMATTTNTTWPIGASGYVYGRTLASRCYPPADRANFSATHFFDLGAAGDAMLAEAEYAVRGAEARGATWMEESFTYQIYGNCPDPGVRKAHVDVEGASLPHIHWTDDEMTAKRQLRKLILYARTTSAPECASAPELCTSWPHLQRQLQATCTIASSNCTLVYVPIEPWRQGISVLSSADRARPGLNLSTVPLWGHWVHSAVPEAFRAQVEAWV